MSCGYACSASFMAADLLGEILLGYGLSGLLILYPCRRLRASTLLIAGTLVTPASSMLLPTFLGTAGDIDLRVRSNHRSPPRRRHKAYRRTTGSCAAMAEPERGACDYSSATGWRSGSSAFYGCNFALYEIGWPPDVLLDGDHHSRLCSGLCVDRTGRKALSSSRVCKDVCDGERHSHRTNACSYPLRVPALRQVSPRGR